MPLLGLPPYAPGPGDGQPGSLTLPGSGLAVPAGMEAVLEYNGLFLNVQKNIDRYRITSIDGLGDPDVRDTRDVKTEDSGEIPFDAFYGGRTVVISGEIQTYSVAKMRDMQTALKAAFADITQEFPLHFRTGDFQKDHIIFCKKFASINMEEAQADNRMIRDFQITLRASNPRFMSYYQRFAVASPAVPTDLSLLGTLVNAGNYLAEPVIRMYGPLTNVTMINEATGETFAIAGALGGGSGSPGAFGGGGVFGGSGTFGSGSSGGSSSATIAPALTAYGAWVEFDIANNTFVDNFGNDQWSMFSATSDYMHLAPGPNPIFYQGDSPLIKVTWRDSWL